MIMLRQALEEAESKRVAIGHFNVADSNMFWGVVHAAGKLGVPVIVGVSEGERYFIGLEQAVALARTVEKETGLPIFINADHTYSIERVKEAIDAGCDSVIFDGAKLSHEENAKIAKEAVSYARSQDKGVLIEAELGYIGKSSKLLDELPEGVNVTDVGMTTPEEAEKFVKETGVDLLAPAVGNVHGLLKKGSNPKLDIDRIAAIRKLSGVPLVLHGGSGISDEDFVKAIDAGVVSIHISTEMRVAYRQALEQTLKDNPDELAPYRLMKPVAEAVQGVVEHRLKLFNKLV